MTDTNSSARIATKGVTETAVSARTKPIIFNGESVRAILGGRKRQTRRVVKPPFGNNPAVFGGGNVRWRQTLERWEVYGAGGAWIELRCPFQVGLTLWVREAFQRNPHGEYWYKADHPDPDSMFMPDGYVSPWKSPIYMPRRASRITLEITGVRVERVQQISENDCESEGLDREQDGYERDDVSCFLALCPAFESLWDSLNAKRGYGWESNPWVFVIEFKRLTTEVGDPPQAGLRTGL